MNIDLLLAIVFYGILLIIFFSFRKRFEVQGKIIVLFKTKLGLKLMGTMANWSPRFMRFLGIVGVYFGFAGMAVILYFLTKGTIDLIFTTGAPPAVAPVLPGVKVPGLPILSFWHWIIGIFLVATVHEFAHGIYARLYNTKVKSSGFLFLGPILGAFVEPDEKQLSKKSTTAQLSVFAAGPFSNMIFGVLFLLLLSYGTGPVFADMYEGTGITVHEFMEGYPAENSGLDVPFTIIGVNGEDARNLETFVVTMNDVQPGETVTFATENQGDVAITTVENPDNTSKAFVGVSSFEIQTQLKPTVENQYGTFLPQIFSWVHMLIFWLFAINIGIGLFNLLPLGPIDGGRMFLTAAFAIFKDAHTAKKIWTFVSFFCLLLIIINLSPYLWKLLLFLVKPFIPMVPT